MGKIQAAQWDAFVSTLTTDEEKDNRVLLFERHLIRELEKWVCTEDRCGDNQAARERNRELAAKGDQLPFEYAVADLQLAFDNHEMMALLEKRATLLSAGKFDAANEVEGKMTELKNRKFDDLTRPGYFFATFHMEHAYVQALFTERFKF